MAPIIPTPIYAVGMFHSFIGLNRIILNADSDRRNIDSVIVGMMYFSQNYFVYFLS